MTFKILQFCVCLYAFCLSTDLHATTFIVTSTNDSGPGSFRQAITDANATPTTDTIIFNIPSAGVQTLSPLTAYPSITAPLVIDGSTQPGYAGFPLIEIDAVNISSPDSGLHISNTSNSTIKGLCVNSCDGIGIYVENSTDIAIEDNIVGLDPTGTLGKPNAAEGIAFLNTSTFTLQRNIIAANEGNNISITGGSTIDISDNIIGLDATGTVNMSAGSGINGVMIMMSSDILIQDNVISGHAEHGVSIMGDATSIGLYIYGNKIGTDITGNVAIGNEINGINILDFTNVEIGGTNPINQNIISGNFEYGISASANELTILGNKIGLADDDSALGNGSSGIYLIDNGAYTFTNSTIGDTSTAGANHIAYNGALNGGGAGVSIEVDASANIPILSNVIYNNAGLGIDLNADGISNNDGADADRFDCQF